MNLDKIKHHYAGIIIETEDGRIIGQQRDNIPGIDNPGKVGTFGGAVEVGEGPRQAAWRELVQEETNLKIDIDALRPFLVDVAFRNLTNEQEVRHFFSVTISDEQLESLKVYEGQGWVEIAGSEDTRLIDLWRPVVRAYLEQR